MTVSDTKERTRREAGSRRALRRSLAPFAYAQGAQDRGCPSWARTRTLLIQSQACCQLHQGAGHLHGAEGSRTPDLCSAIAALSQLSYSPGKWAKLSGRREIVNLSTPRS